MSKLSEAAPGNRIDELTDQVLREGRRQATRDRIGVVLAPTSFIAVLLTGWELAVAAFNLPRYLLPPPSAVFTGILADWRLLLPHARVTLTEVLVGYSMAVVVGLVLAILISESKLAERMIYPVIVAIQATPKSALAPLFLIWFGFGLAPKFAITFLISLFPIVIASVIGLTSIEQEKLELAKLTGLNRLETFRKIKFHGALPSIFGGLRVGITLAVVGAVVGEFVGSDAGLGYMLIQATNTLNTTRVFSTLIVLTSMGILLFSAISFVENFAIPWHVSKRRISVGGA